MLFKVYFRGWPKDTMKEMELLIDLNKDITAWTLLALKNDNGKFIFTPHEVAQITAIHIKK